MIDELRRHTNDALDLPEGTIQPTLHRLQVAELPRSEWEVSLAALLTRGAATDRRQ